MKQVIKRIESLIETAEKFKGAYFFTPPCNAAQRRKYEDQNSIPKFQWVEDGHTYTAKFKVDCSCKNVYAKGFYTKDDKVTNLTAIKNSLKRLKKLN